MAKGVRKIKWTGNGKVISSLSIPNKKAVIAPDQEVPFEVESWYDGTTEDEKKKNITWILQEAKTRKEISKKQMPASAPKRLTIPKALCGPYEYYLEASLEGKRDLYNQTGLIVRGDCPAKILSSKWCQTNNAEDVRKEYFFSYGEQIYLNLKTEGLNGHLNLSIDIFRRVSSGKNVSIKRYTSVDVIDGEINLEINDSFSWYSTIKDKQEIEELYVQVFDPVNRTYIKDNNNDAAHARFLRVRNKIASMVVKPPVNLSPLKTGAPATNYVRYDHCKYIKITQLYKEKEKIIFDEENLKKGKKPKDNLPIHFTAGNEKNEVKIKLESVKLCEKHKPEFLLSADTPGFKINKVNNESFSFDVAYPYKNTDDYAEFFNNYFLISFLVKESLSAGMSLTPILYPLKLIISESSKLIMAHESGIKYAPVGTIISAFSCRYSHVLDVKIYPDVAWSYHFQLGEPKRDALYKNIDIELNRGLKDFFKDVRDAYSKYSYLLPNQIPYLSRIVFDLACTLLEEQAEKFAVGFHSYYNFNESGKPAKIMDYSKKYNTISKSIILAELAGWVIIQAILLYITRGKGVVTQSGRIEKAIRTADKVKGVPGTILGDKFDIILPQISKATGFKNEIQKDGRVALIFEEKIVASPLFALEYKYETSLGKFALAITPLGTIFDVSKKATKIWGYYTKAKNFIDKPAPPTKGKTDFKNPSSAKDVINKTEEIITKKLDAFAKEYGQELSLTITCTGFIDAKIETTVNLLTQDITLKDGVNEYFSNQYHNNEVVYGNKKGIDAIVKLTGKSVINFQPNKIYDYFPKWLKGIGPQMPEYATNTDASGELKGTFYYERKYKFNASKVPVYQDYTIFSGVQGIVKLKIIVKKGDDIIYDIPKDYQNIEFQLIEPFIEEGKEIPLFDNQKLN